MKRILESLLIGFMVAGIILLIVALVFGTPALVFYYTRSIPWSGFGLFVGAGGAFSIVAFLEGEK